MSVLGKWQRDGTWRMRREIELQLKFEEMKRGYTYGGIARAMYGCKYCAVGKTRIMYILNHPLSPDWRLLGTRSLGLLNRDDYSHRLASGAIHGLPLSE